MEITEIRIKLVPEGHERLQAFCSITIDHSFVVRDLKIIHGGKGPFVAMPSRKLTDRCPGCGTKNCLRAAFCNQCGGRLEADRAEKGPDGRAKLYADIAHPINSATRELIQDRVLTAYEAELELAQQPGYVCRYDDFADAGDYDSEDWTETPAAATPQTTERRRVEPAARTPAPPHHAVPASRPREREHATGGHVSPPDEFGAGIL